MFLLSWLCLQCFLGVLSLKVKPERKEALIEVARPWVSKPANSSAAQLQAASQASTSLCGHSPLISILSSP